MRWGEVRTSWGTFYAAWDENGICRLEFPGRRPAARLASSQLLTRLTRELEAFFKGERREFSLPLSLVGTPFQLAVWEELRKVPYGTVVSYGELASRIGRPRAARAVGGAVGANLIPILIPCHRVVRADGELGGFGPGPEWKRRLLELEGRSEMGPATCSAAGPPARLPRRPKSLPPGPRRW